MMKPDLAILDEFQRFFEILEPFRETSDTERQAAATAADEEPAADHKAAQRLLRVLLGGRGAAAAPANMPLSATPYRPSAGAAAGTGVPPYEPIFRLLEFLYDSQAHPEVPGRWSVLRRKGSPIREAAPG